MTIYNQISWVNDAAPAINASNLNHMDAGIVAAHVELASQAVEVASAIAYASTLSANIEANGSAIAANASAIWGNTNAIATLIAEDVLINSALSAQAAANASNTAAVASMFPDVATHAVQIAELYATQGYHSSQIAELYATQGYHSSQLAAAIASSTDNASAIAAIIATQSSIIPVVQDHATTLGQHATRIQILEDDFSNLLVAVGDSNRSGNGPVDLWDRSEPIGITATSAFPRAIGMRYIPAGIVGGASGISLFSVEMLANAGVASAPLQFSAALLSNMGSVIAWAAPTGVPSVATGLVVQRVTLPVTVGVPTNLYLEPGETYFAVLASDDLYRMSVLGAGAQGEAEGIVRHRRGLAYEWALPSGLNLASYGSLPLDGASGPAATSVPPKGYPAVFFN